MNCTRFQKYAGAFADGELSVELNIEALEHVNMCPACARRVADVQELKLALREIWATQTVPADLAAKVRRRVERESPAPTAAPITAPTATPIATQPFQDAATDVPARRGRRTWKISRASMIAVPLATAAVLLLAALQWRPFFPVPEPAPGVKTVYPLAVADVCSQHQRCSFRRGMEHHDKSLSRELPTIAQRLTDRLEMPVLVPDLSDRRFKFVGADRCGIRGRPGAHVLYTSMDRNEWLSLFTVRQIAELAPNRVDRLRDRAYFCSSDGRYSVVSWRESGCSYIACMGGESAQEILLDVFDSVRTASGRPLDVDETVLASAGAGF